MFTGRFPPSEVAARIAVSLGIGLLVGIEREWSNKDLGVRSRSRRPLRPPCS